MQKFVEAFFPKIAELRKPPRHPKWREVGDAAELAKLRKRGLTTSAASNR